MPVTNTPSLQVRLRYTPEEYKRLRYLIEVCGYEAPAQLFPSILTFFTTALEEIAERRIIAAGNAAHTKTFPLTMPAPGIDSTYEGEGVRVLELRLPLTTREKLLHFGRTYGSNSAREMLLEAYNYFDQAIEQITEHGRLIQRIDGEDVDDIEFEVFENAARNCRHITLVPRPEPGPG